MVRLVRLVPGLRSVPLHSPSVGTHGRSGMELTLDPGLSSCTQLLSWYLLHPLLVAGHQPGAVHEGCGKQIQVGVHELE